jgi:microcystin degradation protein MlrC
MATASGQSDVRGRRFGRSTSRPRVAVAGLFHESNTFARRRACYADFEDAGIYRGGEIVEAFADSGATIAGYLDAGRALDIDLHPLMFAQANPMGIIESKTFDDLLAELLAMLRAGGDWDAVLLAQHGAAVADGCPDVDGEVITRVREAVGQGVPIGVSLDLHANISPRMVDAATVTVLYRTNPHLDARLRGFECAELIVRTLRGEVKPVQALVKPPTVVNILRQGTSGPPMALLYQELDTMLGTPGLLTASIAEGYPYADVAEMGMACLAVVDRDRGAALTAAQQLGASTWQARRELQATAVSTGEAVGRAAKTGPPPTLLLDVGDNIGGGSPGDSTTLLHAARARRLRDVVTMMCDADAARACAERGVGSPIEVFVGGREASHDPPFPVCGFVRALSDGKFENGVPVHGGFRYINAGLTAFLESDDGFNVVVCSLPVVDTSTAAHQLLGIDLQRMRAIIGKGVHSPVPAYGPIAADIVLVNTPGVTSADLGSFDYRHRRRPLFPFEATFDYEMEVAELR